MHSFEENLGVVGLGKIGLPLALVLCKAGFNVKGVDISEEVVMGVKSRLHRPEPLVDEYLAKYGDRLTVSTDYKALKDVPIVFVITQTPLTEERGLDIGCVKSAVEEVHRVNPNCLVVVSSTLNPGDCDKLRRIHNRLCYNPEFVAQGKIIRDLENPKFTVIGAYERRDGEKVAEVWRRIHTKPIIMVKPVEAELIKIVLNVKFSMDITFANIVGWLCEKYGADPDVVMDTVNRDKRSYKPGLGYAGPCFPRDVMAFATICDKASIVAGRKLADTLNEINSQVVEEYFKRIVEASQGTIAVLGVTYKPGVPLIDESQPVNIIQKLITKGYKVYVYDPMGMENARKKLSGKNIIFCKSMEECVEKADTVFVGTPWKEFKQLYSLINGKRIIDPWRILKKESIASNS